MMTAMNNEFEFSMKPVKEGADRLMNYFVLGYFLLGLLFAIVYDTWFIAICVGGLSLLAYYSAKLFLADSDVYQYVLSGILGVFMAQYIYQMHGLFEMHFFAFIGSAILIKYQKWKLQIPILLVVFIHHALFSYLHNIGVSSIYFTQLNYFDLQTFAIHILLVVAIFFICGLWAYQLNKYNEMQIKQAIEVARLQQEAYISLEHKQREEALEERNNILESIGDAFFAVDKDQTITYWNNVAETTLKQLKENVIGQKIWDVYPGALETMFYSNFQTALQTKSVVHFETSYHGESDWYETSIYPSKNGLSIYIKDISDRKASELQMKKLNADLQQHGKELAISNEELEQFAYVASHDLQEPLRMITSFLALLEKRYSSVIDEKGKRYIHFAVDGAKRMRQIILDLLAYSRVGRLEDKQEEVDLNVIVKEILSLFHRQIEERQANIKYFNLPTLHSFKAPLRQVFQNLIGNALKYQKAGEKPQVTISCQEAENDLHFTIKDNGIGVEAKHHDSIFIIFRRLHTNDTYQGTGMGLAVTKKIIESLGGKIWINSEENKGSEFHFIIPKAATLLGDNKNEVSIYASCA